MPDCSTRKNGNNRAAQNEGECKQKEERFDSFNNICTKVASDGATAIRFKDNLTVTDGNTSAQSRIPQRRCRTAETASDTPYNVIDIPEKRRGSTERQTQYSLNANAESQIKLLYLIQRQSSRPDAAATNKVDTQYRCLSVL